MKILTTTYLVITTIFLISVVNANLGVVSNIGDPKITGCPNDLIIQGESKKVSVEVTNLAETPGSFNFRAECDKDIVDLKYESNRGLIADSEYVEVTFSGNTFEPVSTICTFSVIDAGSGKEDTCTNIVTVLPDVSDEVQQPSLIQNTKAKTDWRQVAAFAISLFAILIILGMVIYEKVKN